MSDLWSQISSGAATASLDNFRAIGGFNDRLASWGPLDRSSRYYQALMFEFAAKLDERARSFMITDPNAKKGKGLEFFLSKLNKHCLGQPLTINYYGNNVSIDYLLSIEEMLFLKDILETSKNILEIGAGFGRLCHSVVQCYPNLEKYYICDLPDTLVLCKAFLSTVLSPAEFAKVQFIEATKYGAIPPVDLVINIDSMQEIEEKIVRQYLSFISKNSTYFFSKNGICKYDPNTLHITIKNQSQYEAVMRMGLCREIANVFDAEALDMARLRYAKEYCPEGFSVVQQQRGFGQYAAYQSILYRNTSS